MRKNDQWPGLISIGAAGLFGAIMFVVLICFEPTRDLFCGQYDASGISGATAKLLVQDHSCIRNFLYDYQTLLTRILAVSAATATIAVMVGTENAAQGRHDELRAEAKIGRERLLQAAALRYIRRIEKNRSLLTIGQAYVTKTHPGTMAVEDIEAAVSMSFKSVGDMLREPLFERIHDHLSAEGLLANTMLLEMADYWSERWKEENLIFWPVMVRQDLVRALAAMKIIDVELRSVRVADDQLERVAPLYDWTEPEVTALENVSVDAGHLKPSPNRS